MGRVGKEIVLSHKKHSSLNHHCVMQQKLIHERNLEEIVLMLHEMDFQDLDRTAVENAQYDLQRSHVEEQWEASGIAPATDVSQISASKEIIPFSELIIKDQIGEGGFGKVYAGLWKATPIAFKKLSCQQITNKKKKLLVNEIEIFSKLKHANIVKMFGVVTEEKNIGIVMEYLPKTLFHAIFIEEVELDFLQRNKILNEVVLAVYYLHSLGIAHCDIKCQNILLDKMNVAKLCDFGLSFIKNSSTSTSASVASAAPGQGTPRYSAPEVLRGELLELDGLKMADIYSLSLVIYQVLVEEEPFEDLNLQQLISNVGHGNLRPNLDGTTVAEPVKELLAKGWNKAPASRPDIGQFSQDWWSRQVQ